MWERRRVGRGGSRTEWKRSRGGGGGEHQLQMIWKLRALLERPRERAVRWPSQAAVGDIQPPRVPLALVPLTPGFSVRDYTSDARSRSRRRRNKVSTPARYGR